MLGVLRFIEENVPAGDGPLEDTFFVECEDEKNLELLLEKIMAIKDQADDAGSGDVEYGFTIPEGWSEDYGWSDKLETILKFFSEKEGFEILNACVATGYVN